MALLECTSNTGLGNRNADILLAIIIKLDTNMSICQALCHREII